ncbi:MAG: PEP-CTERM sorting domain-containing protein [Gemmatimonadaceae bacterium]
MSVASVVRRAASSAIMTGALLASSAVVAHAQHFIASGGNVSVRFVFSEAGDRSVLSFKVGNGAFSNGSYTDLFANKPGGFSCIGGVIAAQAAANVTGDQCNLGFVAAGTEVFFRLTNTSTPGTYYNSDAAINTASENAIRAANLPDGLQHTQSIAASNLLAVGGGSYTRGFAFEDRPYTFGQAIGTGILDFNDLQFEVAGVGATVTPEPSSVVLMMSGLLALGVAARRRRRV